MTDYCRLVQSHRNLRKAWQVIKRNAARSSSPFIRDDVEQFGAEEQRNILSISARIQHGSYRFKKARGVAIPKASGSKAIRPLVLSRVEDRVVQRCVLDALIKHDQLRAFAFQPNSFGGIPKAHQGAQAGVPAAISCALSHIGNGSTHIIVADIEGFFTRISKDHAVTLVSRYIHDQRFLRLVERAVAVDLENVQALWKHKDEFPRDDLGVAQGNCLSPFLGNLVLAEFDQMMNSEDCQCLRYIDDIMILAPNGRAASARRRKAAEYLKTLGMQFSEAKSAQNPVQVSATFEYLGIEFCRGWLRPNKRSRNRIIGNVNSIARESLAAMRKCSDPSQFDHALSIPKVLNKISGMVKGWAHHYKFCNDSATLRSVDAKANMIFLDYIEEAHQTASKKDSKISAALFGYSGVAGVRFEPFNWPLR